jgi:hypothetical protein
MKFSKLFYIIPASLLVCGIVCADTCYDPNYDRYYNCQGDEYIAPIVAGVLFSAIISNDDGYGGHHGHDHNRNHGNGSRGNHDGNGRHH